MFHAAKVIVIISAVGCAAISGCADWRTDRLGVSSQTTNSPVVAAGSSRQVNPRDIAKTLGPIPEFAVVDGGGAPATLVRSFEVQISQETSTGNTPETFYSASWEYYNVTEDDRTGSFLTVDVYLEDVNGTVLDTFQGRSWRGSCTYDGWASDNIPPIRSKNNDINEVAKLYVHFEYHASYEGKC